MRKVKYRYPTYEKGKYIWSICERGRCVLKFICGI